HLHAFAHQEARVFQRITFNRHARFHPVRNARRIAEVDHVLVRQPPPHRAQNRQTTNSGIEDANWKRIHRNNGGGENRTLVWQPSTKESTYLAASLEFSSGPGSRNGEEPCPNYVREVSLLGSDLHRFASLLNDVRHPTHRRCRS